MDEIKEKLFYEQKNGYDLLDAQERLTCEEYCRGYMDYLNVARTEREAVKEAIRLAEAVGFAPYDPSNGPIQAGEKVYYSNRGKGLMLAVGGRQPMKNGCVITAAHVDAPRLDLKQRPLYEDGELAYLRTHYYGGIKKYQWTAIPMELHGTIAMKDGSTVDVAIGREPGDPQFVITDLLPHLAKDQMSKTMTKGVEGEKLCLLAGSVPYAGDGSDRVKLAVLSLLNDRYGITEADFISAELEAVPAFDVRELGLDRSLIGGYGQDDRVCAYAELAAILSLEEPERTAVCILADKEEIGSYGVTGMTSHAFEYFIQCLCGGGCTVEDCFSRSFCISADVTAAYDPLYADVSEKSNSARINYGVGLCKFTGSGGKSGASDASAEVVAYLRRLCDENGVTWQMCELGKVDQGGGGTVALYMAGRNIDTIDAGVPVLSMHAPFETTSKLDCYMTYKCMKAAYNA
ncbi:MAG: aminopeptidase [Oscillospiraceae bacterium]|nr:aminopeptidase [Oscillospiraceae bacterium]